MSASSALSSSLGKPKQHYDPSNITVYTQTARQLLPSHERAPAVKVTLTSVLWQLNTPLALRKKSSLDSSVEFLQKLNLVYNTHLYSIVEYKWKFIVELGKNLKMKI